MENRIDFIIAIHKWYEAIERVISRVIETIEETRYHKEFNYEIIFEKEVVIERISNLRVFCYYNSARAQQEKGSF